MNIIDDYCKNYNTIKEIKKYCEFIIDNSKDKNEDFYIGITNNPEQRLKSHYNGNGNEFTRGMGTMILLCKVDTEIKAKRLEQKLIKHYNNRKNLLNQSAGGEGDIGKHNYVYLLLE